MTTTTPMRVFMTGATGSFGREVARRLLEHGCELVLLGRGRDQLDAQRRVRTALGGPSGPGRVVVVRGDVALPGLGLSCHDSRLVADGVDAVLHAAASTAFGVPLAQARAGNVEGTRNVLAFAQGLGRLQKLAYVSTAFVAGRRTGRIGEGELAHDAGFVTTYEQSKNEAEQLVRAGAGDHPLTVFRPSVVCGCADEPGRPSGLRFALSLVQRGLLPVLPAEPATPLDLIDSAGAAAALASILLMSGASGTYHLAAGDQAPSVAAILAAAGAPAVRFAGREAFERELDRLALERPRLARLYGQVAGFLPILAYPKVFDTARAEAVLGRPVAAGHAVAA